MESQGRVSEKSDVAAVEILPAKTCIRSQYRYLVLSILPASLSQFKKESSASALAAALPPPVRKASGFPTSPQLFWRLRRPRRSLSFLSDERKARGFPHGRRQSRTTIHGEDTHLWSAFICQSVADFLPYDVGYRTYEIVSAARANSLGFPRFSKPSHGHGTCREVR